MAAALALQYVKRQSMDGSDDGDGGDYDSYGYDNTGGSSWWYSNTAETVKYVVVFTIIGLILVWVLGGSIHAHRRLRQGKPLLWYHRWLVSRRYYVPAPPPNVHASDAAAPNGQQYQMQTWSYATAPPAYGHDAPPAYVAPPGPPAGASKVNPSQTVGVTPVNAEEETRTEPPAGVSIQRPSPAHPAPATEH